MGFGTLGDLALVVIGFSLIIFLHELGHFAAARWARIRVLAFALGFGPAAFSFRKGLGFRRGSSEREYQRRLKEHKLLETGAGVGFRGSDAFKLSPTEYRLNILPLGGYVKMLGQDDSDPAATSDEPDSFNRAPVYKRMVVISAGVVMNIITAAILFVIVFSYGIKTESPRIGNVQQGSAAEQATAAVGAKKLEGLKAGDTVLAVGDEQIEAFKDISLAIAMSRKDQPITVVVRRPGVADPITFVASPRVDPGTNMLSLGIWPAVSGTIAPRATEKDRAALADMLAHRGAKGVGSGMTLVDADGSELTFDWLNAAAKKSDGRPFATRWRRGDGASTVEDVTITPQPQLQETLVEHQKTAVQVEHLAGLTPVMGVRAVTLPTAEKAGLKAGDVFALIGDVQWPSIADGVRQIGAASRSEVHVAVLRNGEIVDLGNVPVVNGKIGFELMHTAATRALVTRFPVGKASDEGVTRDPAHPFAAAAADMTPGSEILRVGDVQTGNLFEVRAAVQALLAAGIRDVHLTIAQAGVTGEKAAPRPVVLHFDDADANAVVALGWESPIPADFFGPDEVIIKRSSPVAAVTKGLDETKKMVLTTYLTFARLFQGTVKVEHLKGPIGIADVGTKLAGKGMIWLLFFMAAVSVNLAVVNFLPLPIVDGGHFCFLLWEQFTGRPVSPAVQNVAALVGLALIGAVFLMTTYNDLANLWK
jgi:regulator of sigma E protease